MNISETAAEATLRADRDKEIALADADLQKQLTGNESAHATAVNNANSAHSTATANAEAARKTAEQAALTQLNSTLAQATKDSEASIAGAERTYDQAVAALDAQYGSASSNGDTGVEGATRRSAIKTRDAQYYAARDTSWANTLSGSTTLGTSPWTVKAITAANAQAAFSTSRASAQAAHDAAILDAMEDWQLSSRESLTDLLFTEGQSRETYNIATSNVYANWENGVGNLLGGKPEGTEWGEGMNLGGDENNQPHGPNNTPGNGFAAFVVWTPHEPEPPKKPQPIPPPPQQPHADDNIFSSPERPSIEKLQFLYDHFGKDRAEELIEMRWPSKPYPESKYSMSAYEPSNKELLAQGFPGYERLRYLIDRYEAGATNGRERDEMRQLATDFQFYWRVNNGSGGTLMGTAMMVTGLTVAGQNPKFNSFAGSASAVIAARPTPMRPYLRLEIKPRYTQQPVLPAPKTFTTKPASESPSPKFKIQPVVPPTPLDKLQTAAPTSKTSWLTLEEFNAMPETGTVSPWRLRTSQDSAPWWFKPPYEKSNIGEAAYQLREKITLPSDFKPVLLVEYNGMIYSVDNRRILTFRSAGLDIRYEKTTWEDLTKGQRRHFTTVTNGESIFIEMPE